MSNESTSAVSKPLETSDLDTETGQEEPVEVGLVRDAQSGDPEAFAELVRKYQRRAVSLAYRLLGNIEDAGDVSQEAFIRAYRHLSQLDDPSRFGAWFLRVVSNLSLNYRRSRKSRSAISLDDVEAVERAATFRSGGFPRRLKPAAHFAGGGAVGLEDGGGPLANELHEAITQALEHLPEAAAYVGPVQCRRAAAKAGCGYPRMQRRVGEVERFSGPAEAQGDAQGLLLIVDWRACFVTL